MASYIIFPSTLSDSPRNMRSSLPSPSSFMISLPFRVLHVSAQAQPEPCRAEADHHACDDIESPRQQVPFPQEDHRLVTERGERRKPAEYTDCQKDPERGGSQKSLFQ